MNFVSLEYFLFFICVLLVLKILPNKFKTVILLISSYVFYSFWDYRFLVLILISTISDFIISNLIHKESKFYRRKILLLWSIFVNLSILFTFKYFNFFIDAFLRFGFANNDQMFFNTLEIILPVGISFYTFQTMSYTIDVYKNEIQPETNFITFSLFVCFFPQLVAGPIERASSLLPQLKKPAEKISLSNKKKAIYLITQGIVFKSVIADNISNVVESIYLEFQFASSSYLTIAIFCFCIQIYCDFAGYSRIARGSALFLGITLSQNFNFPYLATSISDFWRKWHITLSFWFRDYLYIPLGGNRNKVVKNIFNLLFTMLVAGLWHGAGWNFILWGFLYGLILSLRYVKNIIKVDAKDLIFALFFSFLFFQIAIKPITFDYFERYNVEISENSIYNFFPYPADGRCMNSITFLNNLEIENVEIVYEEVKSSYKCHNAVYGVSTEEIPQNSSLTIYRGKNELLPFFLTREIFLILLLGIFLLQKKYSFKIIKRIATFSTVALLWVPFRIEGFENIKNIFYGLFHNNSIVIPPTEHWSRLLNIENSNYLSLLSSKFMFPITIFLLVEFIDYKTKNLDSISSTKYVLLINCYLILILLFSARNYAPFIYFQF